MISNPQLRELSLAQLKGKWAHTFLLSLIYAAINGATTNLPIFLPLRLFAHYIILLPLFEFGVIQYFIHMARKEVASPKDLLAAFDSESLASVIILFLVKSIFISLWFLLLIAPGFIKACSYAMAVYILRDNPNMKPLDALNKSKIMMDGHKWQYCCLILSFTGWFILSLLTFGIGLLWLIPYMKLSSANFYENLRNLATADLKT